MRREIVSNSPGSITAVQSTLPSEEVSFTVISDVATRALNLINAQRRGINRDSAPNYLGAEPTNISLGLDTLQPDLQIVEDAGNPTIRNPVNSDRLEQPVVEIFSPNYVYFDQEVQPRAGILRIRREPINNTAAADYFSNEVNQNFVQANNMVTPERLLEALEGDDPQLNLAVRELVRLFGQGGPLLVQDRAELLERLRAQAFEETPPELSNRATRPFFYDAHPPSFFKSANVVSLVPLRICW